MSNNGMLTHRMNVMRFFSSVYKLVLLIAATSCLLTQQSMGATAGNSELNVEITKDVIYGHKHGMALTMNIIEPEQPNGAGIVLLNSGGYVSPVFDFLIEDADGLRLRRTEELGGQERQYAIRPLLEKGYTIFDVRHGSSPKFLVPEIVDDVRKSVRFIKNNASDYDISPDRLGLWGGSAGGHLSLMLGTAADIGPAMDDETNAESAPVAAVVAYFPPTEFTSARVQVDNFTQENMGTDYLNVFPAFGFPEDRDASMSPVNYASADDPPILIIHGDQDSLVPLEQGQLMHDALQDAGAISELIIIEGAAHGFSNENGEMALNKSIEWFDKYLQ